MRSSSSVLPLESSGTPSRMLRLAAVRAKTGLSTTTIWRLRRRGEFPNPIQLSPGCVAWREADLEAWIASRESVNR